MYRPRSGMVPALVTASSLALPRASTVPSTRSHTTRGRSSANSSEGYLPASMSRVASKLARPRSRYGAARRTIE